MKNELNKFLDGINNEIEIIADIANDIQNDFYEWLVGNYAIIDEDNIDDFILVMRRRLIKI